jgi:V8-like Glu-specific endopeptidase
MQSDSRETSAVANGQPPDEYAAGAVAGKQLYTPAPSTADREEIQSNADELPTDVVPSARGTVGANYTSTRVFPLYTRSSAPLSADRAYPYSTVGKLFFSVGGAPFVCSGAVIQRRIVLTAGHCVHSGTASGFHSNFLFVPAFRDGSAPFQTWTWAFATTTPTWASGGGTFPNAADYAMIEFNDRSLSPSGLLTRLGQITGFLGWQTLSLANNHTSKLGYPSNLDRGEKMQNITSGSFRSTVPNNVEYGSDAREGSSGGPWVQNFQQVALGGGTGLNNASNRVVGVTSYIFTSVDPKIQGASVFDNRFITLYNTICAHKVGNCS